MVVLISTVHAHMQEKDEQPYLPYVGGSSIVMFGPHLVEYWPRQLYLPAACIESHAHHLSCALPL